MPAFSRRPRISDDMSLAGGGERYDQLMFETDPRLLEARAATK